MSKIAGLALLAALGLSMPSAVIAQDSSSSSSSSVMDPSSVEPAASSGEISSSAETVVQDATAALSAQLEAVKAACPVEKAVEADCRTAIGSYISTLDGLGLDATAYDDQLSTLVKALVTEPCVLPEPVRQFVAAAITDTIVPKFKDDTRRQAAVQIGDDIAKCASTEVSAISSTPSPNL